MKPLFLFGTLMHLPLLKAVLGAVDHLEITATKAPGFALLAVAEGPFPMIREDTDACVEGVLIDGLTASDFARLDYYKGAFDYTLRDLRLSDGTNAQTYFLSPARWSVLGAWSFEDWVADWSALSVEAACEVMSYFGTKSAQDIAFMFPMIRARAWARLNARQSRHGAGTLHGQVEIKSCNRAYARFFALDDYQVRHERFDGQMTPVLDRAVFVVGDAALVLPYDPVRDRVLLVEQMRMGPLARGDRAVWQYEPVAGRLDGGETPQEGARREALEEAGLELGRLLPVAETYCSPGNSSEFYYIFVGLADLSDDVAGVGGLAAEDEDIRSCLMSFEDLMNLCDTQRIANAPLAIAAYWLARHRAGLMQEAGAAS